ncbi:MAG: UvrD-helicase domain-containing protein, partial [Eubacteriales bacterium]|nr:UvrD-helicase domain-containing protein [Eubacteriales bacterium]
MAEFHLTPDQESAVTARDSAVLVSAAAGSGKTRVLVERLMRRVAEGEDIDRFLIITYTRAAAGELRGRIQTELGRLSAAHPEDRRLRRQAGLCCRAPIGTIHSFCTSLLRENAQALSLVPNFRVADDNRALAIRASVLERLMDRLYTELDVRPGLRSLIDTVGAGRDDSRLTALVLELHTVLRSHPWPARWAAEQLRAMDVRSITDAGETPWGREILDNAAENALYWAERMENALHEMSSPEHERLFTAYGPSFSDSAAGLRALARESARGWDAACACLPIPFPNLKAFRGEDALKDEVTALRNTVKKAAADLLKQLEGPSERHLRELDEMRPAMSALLSLAVELDTAFSAEKRRQGLLDFSDLEHLSLRLLEDPETGARTPLAEAVSRRYCEIMVDEYQDVSEIQDRLFRAVSREDPENLFFVGDVKQSIYRFRLAEPGIFLKKLHSWADADAPKGTPRRILLRENFRSRGSVLAAANHVFSALMSPRLGELRYDEEASLRQGAVYPPEGEVPALLSVLSLPRS